MSSRPMDLQVVFSQMNHVGRDQAASKNAQLHSQMVAGEEIAQESKELDSKIGKSQKAGDGSEKVTDDEHRAGRDPQDKSNRQPHNQEKKKNAPRKEDLFSNPALGKHINLSG